MIRREIMSTSKDKKIDEFMRQLRANSSNVTDEPVSDLFSGVSPFRVMCMKCGTLDVSIIGEHGGCGSPETGSWPGSLTIKCRKCGSAESCNDVY
jgi:hypothetical protein